MQVDLSGKAAVVTGGSQGIGLAIANALAFAGASLAIIGKESQHLREALPQLETSGEGAVRPFRADLADAHQVRAVSEEILQQFGAVDILVNNAGTRTVSPLNEIPLEEWERTLAVNLTAPLLLTQAFSPGMAAKGWGRIVNIASVAGSLAFRERAGYNASKAGLIALTKSAALELGSLGIRCNAVSPGLVETNLNRTYLQEGPIREVALANTPVGHLGKPDSIAAPVLFLCSDQADYLNGADIPVDGGWLAGKGY